MMYGLSFAKYGLSFMMYGFLFAMYGADKNYPQGDWGFPVRMALIDDVRF